MSIEITVQNSIGIATFNRPEVMNSFNAKILTEWQTGIRSLADHPDVRAIVVTGAGPAFCAGMDLKQRFDGGEDTPWSADTNQASRLVKALSYGNDFVRTLAGINQPTIAAINGHTIGAGLSFAAACDIRLASTNASFAAPFIELGISGGDLGLSWFLPRIVGLPQATDIILNRRKFDAHTALDLGFVTAVEDDVFEAAVSMANGIASVEPYGVMMSKKLLAASSTNSLDTQLDAELTAQSLGTFTDAAQVLKR